MLKSLSDIRLKDSSVFGGKAASLGELTSAGFPVPRGFAVSAHAVDTKSLALELDEAFKKLGVERVAVRSSALAEDSADASWAGQLDTYLNVGGEDLLASFRKCRASINSLRAKAYAEDKSLAEGQLSVGVVVQEMVQSEVSGVVFTADPVTKDRSKMVIEGIYGLGELIVQGEVTPDHWQIAKSPLLVEVSVIASQHKQLIYVHGQMRTVPVPTQKAKSPCLTESEILSLGRIGLGIEAHYESPQDIEWAKAGNSFFVVQSRPITTLQ